MESWGYPTIAVSAAGGVGLNRLLEVLSGRVSIFAGPSGVGKSSLINALKLRAAQDAGPGAVASRGGSSLEANTPCHSSNASSSSEDGLAEGVHVRAGEEAVLQQHQPSTSWVSSLGAGHDRHAVAQPEELQSQNGSSHTAGHQSDCSGAPEAASVEQLWGGADAESRRAEMDGAAVGVSGRPAGVVDPLEQWRGMQDAAQALGLQPVGDLTAIGRGKHTTRHVSLLEVRCPPVLQRFFLRLSVRDHRLLDRKARTSSACAKWLMHGRV